MKAIILLSTLKNTEQSNTETLVEFVGGYLAEKNINFEVVKLLDYQIRPGTCTYMETDDDWPMIYQKILQADILIFATPIWWNNHSSELQRCMERLIDIYDIIGEGGISPLDGKIGGIIITGDADGVEHVTGNLANFFLSMGITMPPYTSVGVLWDGHAKESGKSKADLLQYYKEVYANDAFKMADYLINAKK
jgi:multimeric flavodoxin WrbA